MTSWPRVEISPALRFGPTVEVAHPQEQGRQANAHFRMEIVDERVVIFDENGARSSYLEWAVENTDLTVEMFEHAKVLLRGSGSALEGWLALAERK